MNPLFPEEFLKDIVKHAEAEYPRECCGLILGYETQAGFSRIVTGYNRQDDYHKKDPTQFPRTSRSAYFLDPLQLLELQKKIRETREMIKIIYHSHIDAPAVFSKEDKKGAMPDGVTVYPGTDYLVLSVFQGKAKEAALYRCVMGLFEQIEKRTL